MTGYNFSEALERAHARGPQLIDAAYELAAVAWKSSRADPAGRKPKVR